MIALLAVVAMFAGAAMVALSVVWYGYALSVLWGWFIVPALGAPALSVPSAIGIAIVVSYMTHQYSKKNSVDIEGWEATAEALAFSALKPLLTLGIGWIVKQWI